MAVSSTIIKCIVCGKDFEVRKTCRNRADADNFSAWASSHIDTCRECQAAQARKAGEDRLAGILTGACVTLPTITGASDKQIAYATDVRAKYLSAHTEKVEEYLNIKAEEVRREADLRAWARDHGRDYDEALAESYAAYGLTTVRCMLQSTCARDILDADRRF